MEEEEFKEKTINFLKGKGMIKEGYSHFIISGDFGKLDLVELLREFGNWYVKELFNHA